MANFSNRICNPTPFDVVWHYDKGVKLNIPADGHLDLEADVVDDFRPDKPGSEEVMSNMRHYGIFVRDHTRPFEAQAIEAIEASIASKGSMYDNTYQNLRRSAAAAGIYDENAFAETLTQMGYTALNEKVNTLKERLKKIKSRYAAEDKPRYQQFDPTKTLLFLNPPREFDSPVAMEIFLDDNPDLRAEQDNFLAQLKEADNGSV